MENISSSSVNTYTTGTVTSYITPAAVNSYVSPSSITTYTSTVTPVTTYSSTISPIGAYSSTISPIGTYSSTVGTTTTAVPINSLGLSQIGSYKFSWKYFFDLKSC